MSGNEMLECPKYQDTSELIVTLYGHIRQSRIGAHEPRGKVLMPENDDAVTTCR